jgi:hypothetical protein
MPIKPNLLITRINDPSNDDKVNCVLPSCLSEEDNSILEKLKNTLDKAKKSCVSFQSTNGNIVTACGNDAISSDALESSTEYLFELGKISIEQHDKSLEIIGRLRDYEEEQLHE